MRSLHPPTVPPKHYLLSGDTFTSLYHIIFYIFTLHLHHCRPYVLSSFRKTNDSSNRVKFCEFAQFLLDEKSRRREQLDRHWRPQWELCSPCDVAYDFIGHYETLYDDAAVVLSRIGIKSDLFPRDDVRWRRAAARLNETMSTLTKDTVDQLKQLYAGDFELFGY